MLVHDRYALFHIRETVGGWVETGLGRKKYGFRYQHNDASLTPVKKNALFIVGAQLTSVSPVTNVTLAFKSMGETSVNRVGKCGQQRTFDDPDWALLTPYVGFSFVTHLYMLMCV